MLDSQRNVRTSTLILNKVLHAESNKYIKKLNKLKHEDTNYKNHFVVQFYFTIYEGKEGSLSLTADVKMKFNANDIQEKHDK